ncbi:MAG: hypothetical protein WCA37_06830 [Terracidiphilus sp.]
MKLRPTSLAAVLILLPVGLTAQFSMAPSTFDAMAAGGGVARRGAPVQSSVESGRPFSRYAIGAVLSPMGPGAELTTYLNNHFNVRATGNVFSYSTTFTASGFPANASLNMASARISGDIYPFNHGFRLSPGLMMYNGNELTASSNLSGGSSFTLNGNTYYSANANPATGATPLSANALMGLHTNKPAFTMTAGWGNTIPRNGHWSFPFEVGAAFIGSPSVQANLSGWACVDPAQTMCTNVASTTDPIALQIQSDLNGQIAKWKNDLDPLKTFPLVSFGVAYSFSRGGMVH